MRRRVNIVPLLIVGQLAFIGWLTAAGHRAVAIFDAVGLVVAVFGGLWLRRHHMRKTQPTPSV